MTTTSVTPPRAASFPALLAVVAFSGACSLTYQVVWFRMFRQIFGSSTEATGIVVALFMGGLGLGGLVFGHRASGFRKTLGVYALVEAGIATTAAATPILLEIGHQTYLAAGGSTGLGGIGSLLVRMTLATIVLGPPTLLMGGTLPLIAQVAATSRDEARTRVAGLYGVNTVGAVIGALSTTFFLLEAFGLRRTLWFAAAINLMLAVWVRARFRETAASEDGRPGLVELERPQEREASEPRPSLVPVLLGAAFAVGFVFFLMELVWYRMLSPILGGTSYTFGLVLATALLGIGSGGLAYASGSSFLRPTQGLLAATCILEGTLVAIPFALGDGVALLAAALRQLTPFGLPGLVSGWAVVTGIVVLPASIVAGFQFPLLVALLGRRAEDVGRDVGTAYALNTLGAVLGSLAGGFGLLPALGAPRLWQVCVLALLGTGLAIGLWSDRRRAPVLVAPALIVLALVSAEGPTAIWRHSAIGAGRFQLPASPEDYWTLKRARAGAVAAEADGRESSVAVLGTSDLALIVNGKSDGAAIEDFDTTIMSGMLPAALHPEPKSAFVLGWGTGTTAGWLAAVDSIETVVVAELEPAVLDMAPLLDSVALDVLDNPKVDIRLGDGRELLMTSGEQYDIIFSEPSNPYRAGVADLFSRDFYRAVRDRSLTEDGLFVQWLQGYELDVDVFETVLATLGSVFGHVETWKVGKNDFALLAGRRPILHDPEQVAARCATSPLREALARTWGVEGVAGLYTGWVAGPELAETLGDRRVSSDDHPIVEYSFARNVGRTGRFDESKLVDAALRAGAIFPPASLGLDPSELAEARATRMIWQGRGDLVRSPILPGSEGLLRRTRARVAWTERDLRDARQKWEGDPPRSPFDRLLVAEAFADGGTAPDPDALSELDPANAAAIRARFAWRSADTTDALHHLRDATRLLGDAPWIAKPVFAGLDRLAREIARESRETAEEVFDSFSRPFSGNQFEMERCRLLFELTPRLAETDRPRMVAAMVTARRCLPQTVDVLEAESIVLERWGHPLAPEILADLEHLRRLGPSEFSNTEDAGSAPEARHPPDTVFPTSETP